MASVDVTRIASNIQALNALNSLQMINAKLAMHQQRLSTGKRINSAADDPAGLTIATKMLARSEGLKASIDNISDAKNMLSVAEGGLSTMTDILITMRSMAEKAASDTLGSSERATIQTQLSSYSQQLQDLVDQTKWNGVKLLDQSLGTKVFQTGVDEGETTSWGLSAKLDPASMNLSTSVLVPTGTVSSGTTSFQTLLASGTQINATGTLANNQTELSTGSYAFEILDKSTSSTQGKVNTTSLASGLTSVVYDPATMATSTAELKSGHYRLTIVAATSQTTTTWKIENLDDATWNGGAALQVIQNLHTTGSSGILRTVPATATTTLGVKLNFAVDPTSLVSGSMMNFEYIAAGQTKFELNDALNAPVQINQQTTGTSTGLFGYATNGAAFTTGRGVQVQTHTAVTAGDRLVFDYKPVNAYSVDVSSATKAGKYMTYANTALDKVTSALSDLGSMIARLTFKEQQSATAQVNIEGAYSRIMNANMAEEQLNASKYTILQQTATAMLAQANAAPQSLLALFR